MRGILARLLAYSLLLWFSGQAEAAFLDVKVKWISNNAVKGDGIVSWDPLQLGTTNWIPAEQYLELSIDSGFLSGKAFDSVGLQIYTDNMGTGANPRFSQRQPDRRFPPTDPAGLVGVNTATDVNASSFTLPMAWRMSDVKLKPMDLSQINDATRIDPYFGVRTFKIFDSARCICVSTETYGAFHFNWLFVRDRNSPDLLNKFGQFPDGLVYLALYRLGAGSHINESNRDLFPCRKPYRDCETCDPRSCVDEPVYAWSKSDEFPKFLYLCAQFEKAKVPRTYKTNRLIIELYTK